MGARLLLHLAIGLLPVLAFLGVLFWLESHKLVRPATVLAVVACGAGVGVASYFVNGWAIELLHADFRTYTYYAAPLIEELLKGLVIVALIRSHRIGFLVDAAILGFSAGAGFAVVENLWYQVLVPDASLGTWIVRGFGTAIMHGGATAMFAMSGIALRERWQHAPVVAYLPGYAVAVALHAAYNHTFLPPALTTLAVVVVLPPLFYGVFLRSEAAVGDWLGRGFDADAEMLDLLNSGRLADSPVGRYLQALRARFDGTVVADLLCYLRLHTELAMRAKGLLMMRANGFDVPADAETRAKFDEMAYLEKSVGRTGLLAIQPMLHLSHRELWELNVLGASTPRAMSGGLGGLVARMIASLRNART